MSKKEIEVSENIKADLKETQDKLINQKDSPYKKLTLPNGAKLTRKTLTANLCVSLLWIYKFYRHNENAEIGQYYTRKEFFTDLIGNKDYESIIKNYTDLKFWGLIEPMPTSPTEIIYKKGYWGISENALAFCQKEIGMPKYAYVYNGFAYEHKPYPVMIEEVLSEAGIQYKELILI